MLSTRRNHFLAAAPAILPLALLGACSSPEEGSASSETAMASIVPVQTPTAQTQVAAMPAPPSGQPPVAAQPASFEEALVVDLPSDEMVADMVDDGSAEEEVSTMVTEECASTEVTATDVTMVQPADIIFAIDTSQSMTEEIAFVQTYMNQFSQQIIDSGIDVHVILVGNPQPDAAAQPMQNGGGLRGGANQGICIGAPLGSGTCPADENLPVFAHVTSSVGSNDVLNVIVDTYPQWQQHLRPEASKSFVVVSDDDATDAPNNSAATFTTALQALDPTMFAEWTFSGIFCGLECEASAAIGAVFQDLVAQTDGVQGELCEQDFQPVFDRLAEQIITAAGNQIACEWELPPAPVDQTFSVDLVEVTRTTPAAGAVPFTRVASIDECGLSSWYFDDPLNPTKILACPETCEAMQEEDGGSIDVSFSCELIAGCATSSASTVMATDGTACDFPLPTPPNGVVLDVSTVNVRYTTPSGFGVVLGTVQDAADCANVEAGWYFDDPSSPSTISLCPSTCEAYQAGTLTNVEALFGCDSKPAPRAK